MTDIAEGSDARAWAGPTGTILELWPAAAWPGEDVSRRRDYALCFAAANIDHAIAHFEACGLNGRFEPAIGRWLSDIDPVLGVRIALEHGPRA
ncbi:MAG: hypothetical protein IT303_12205 [Dehalococcoidia bacterium]|nr:hypothetical protein [Dehalococcoidia bacterium]